MSRVSGDQKISNVRYLEQYNHSVCGVIDVKYRQTCICRVARQARAAHKYLLIDCIRGN